MSLSGKGRWRATWPYAPVGALAEVAGTRAGWESSRVRLRGGKIFVDGTLDGRTATRLTDYRDAARGFREGRR